MAKKKRRRRSIVRKQAMRRPGCLTALFSLLLVLLMLAGYHIAGEPLGGLKDIPFPDSIRPTVLQIDQALTDTLPTKETVLHAFSGLMPKDFHPADAAAALWQDAVKLGSDGLAQLSAWLGSQNISLPGMPELPFLSGDPPSNAVSGSFEIHFLDVGQADAALILCDGQSLMIDGGNAADSSFIYSYLKNTLQLSRIDTMIATHAHEDHIGGLSGALNACTVGKLYCPVTSYDSRAFSSLVKYADRQGLSLVRPKVGDSFTVGQAKVTFLSPAKDYRETNDTSIVVRIVFGNTSFLFTGDAEWEPEHDMVESGMTLASTLLKVGHHGSSSSTSYVFLREVMPKYAVISCEKNNKYGHPTEQTLSRLRDVGAEIYRTDLLGTIVVKSDGKNLTFMSN